MSDIPEQQEAEMQFNKDTITGRYVQKQSIPKWLIKAVGRDNVWPNRL